MATKRELKVEIETLSQQLGVPIDTERQNLQQLTELAESLRQQVAARGVEGSSGPPAADGPPAEVPPAPEPGLTLFAGATRRSQPAAAAVDPPSEPLPEAATEGSVVAGATEDVVGETPAAPTAEVALPTGPAFHRVAQGCVIYTLRGKLGAFKRISARDLQGGKEMLDELVRAGQVERKR